MQQVVFADPVLAARVDVLKGDVAAEGHHRAGNARGLEAAYGPEDEVASEESV
jgi:hypothetical protein